MERELDVLVVAGKKAKDEGDVNFGKSNRKSSGVISGKARQQVEVCKVRSRGVR